MFSWADYAQKHYHPHLINFKIEFLRENKYGHAPRVRFCHCERSEAWQSTLIPSPRQPHSHIKPMPLQQRMLLGLAQVVRHHLLHHLVQGDLWHPAQVGLGFAGVAQQGLYLGGAEIAWVCIARQWQ